MINIVNKYPVAESGDGGDSAVRAGILAITKSSLCPDLQDYENKHGMLMRHPYQQPWNSTGNYSRDQMLPFIAGCYVKGLVPLIRRVFWRRLDDCFFMQNFERDWPGSKKLLIPHEFYKDSDPIPDTFYKAPQALTKENTPAIVESRVLDWADILMPNHIWFLIKAAQFYWLYWFALVGVPFFILNLYFHCKSKTAYEENQIISECLVNGQWAVNLYKKWCPNWEKRSEKYWSDRNEIEYHIKLKRLLK